MFIGLTSFFLRSSVGAQSRLPGPAQVHCPVSLLTERDIWVYAGSYKHLAPLERKQIQLLHFQPESTNDK
jgi:hypothetical protein